MSVTYTTHYNFGKQEDYSDLFSMKVITDNWDSLDTILYSFSTGKQDKLDSSHKLSVSYVDFTSAQIAALNSGIDSDKVEQIESNEIKHERDTLISDTTSHNWGGFNLSDLSNGYYLIFVKNAVDDSTWYGLSAYLTQKTASDLKMWTAVAEVTSAKVTNVSITAGTGRVVLDFDAMGYHTVIAQRIG